MSPTGHHRGLAVTVAGAALLTLGLALALAKKPAVEKKLPQARAVGPTLDCKALEKRLSQCGPAIAAAFDAGLGARLAKQNPALRAAVLRTISAEFVERVANPCYASKGQLPQGDGLAACMGQADAKAKATTCKAGDKKCAAARQVASCRAFATCLATRVRALPRKRPAASKRPAPRKK